MNWSLKYIKNEKPEWEVVGPVGMEHEMAQQRIEGTVAFFTWHTSLHIALAVRTPSSREAV